MAHCAEKVQGSSSYPICLLHSDKTRDFVARSTTHNLPVRKSPSGSDESLSRPLALQNKETVFSITKRYSKFFVIWLSLRSNWKLKMSHRSKSLTYNVIIIHCDLNSFILTLTHIVQNSNFITTFKILFTFHFFIFSWVRLSLACVKTSSTPDSWTRNWLRQEAKKIRFFAGGCKQRTILPSLYTHIEFSSKERCLPGGWDLI